MFRNGRDRQKGGITTPGPAVGATVGYSQTNIQVAGVDEPDIVKNDDRYIYTISGSTLAIIDAYPAAGCIGHFKNRYFRLAKRSFCHRRPSCALHHRDRNTGKRCTTDGC